MMNNYFKRNKILLLLIAIAVLVSFAVIARRWQAESKNKTYDVVLDYSELELLVEQSDKDMSWWLTQFRDMGITRVGLTEESLATLMENSPLPVTATMMDEVMQEADWMEDYPAAFVNQITRRGYDRYDVLVQAAGEEAVGFVTDAVTKRFHPEDVVMLDQGDECYILINGTVGNALYGETPKYHTSAQRGFSGQTHIVSSKIIYVSLGLMPEKVETIQSLGMEIIPRTLCYNGMNDSYYAQAVLDSYQQFGLDPAYVIAGGEAVIGCDDVTDHSALDYIRDNNITIGLIETNVQRENILQTGVEDIAKATGFNTVRVFSVWDYIQFRYAYYGYTGAEEIENTFYRAIVERNIRIIYFKPIKFTDDMYTYITDIGVYQDLFNSLDQRLSSHGITRGQASVLDNIEVPRLAMLALGLGAGFCGALLPETCLPLNKKWTVLLAGAAAVLVTAAWLVLPNTFRLLASFSSAVVFSCLAAVFFLRSAKSTAVQLPANAGLGKILPRTIGILVISTLISLCGAMMTAAPLSCTSFMLEIGIFRGVKAAQLIPLAFFCVLFLSCYGLFKNDRKRNTLCLSDIVTALKWTIPVWAVAVVAVVGAAGYYYLARTGHETNVSVSTIEIIFRNDLEKLLIARPRTKEFLVAFPGIMLAVYCAVRRLPFFTAIFGLAGTIGMTSVCNTFMHIRTPLYLGFARTAYSLALGIIVGAVYI
ncbi:MAG: hypothetical protein K2O18_02535, partial [Oscillospiraceae bacterium]|nr:hypothetical protein [Oscillospiraceae bacterium]